jgi:lipoprotein-releasing system permease protein
MFQPLPIAIGLRYLRAKRRNQFISFISAASILGIIIGVMVLITTLAVMSGFQREFRDRLLASIAHATIEGVGEPLPQWREAIAIAEADARVAGAAPYVRREGLLSGSRTQAALVMGIDPAREGKVSELPRSLVRGDFNALADGGYGILLGEQLAMMLGVRVGDRVNVTLNEFTATPLGALPRSKRFTVVGIFSMGEATADTTFAYVALGDAQRVLRLGDRVSGVRLKLQDLWQAEQVSQELSAALGGFHQVSNWMRDNRNMFGALKTERTMMFILLSLVIAIAAFNLVSSLVMLVQDKQADIAILRTLGLSPAQVMQVFIVQGSVIGVVGTAIGVVAGVLLSLNLGAIVRAIEGWTGTELMPADVYYITGVPTAVYPADVAAVAVVSLLLCFLATLYPAWRAARTEPAVALRYE